MPYIKAERRVALVNMEAAAEAPIMTPGELNFTFTCCIKEFMRIHGLSYQTINDVIGALEGAKLEFYRRVAAPYEDFKREENGDVY